MELMQTFKEMVLPSKHLSNYYRIYASGTTTKVVKHVDTNLSAGTYTYRMYTSASGSTSTTVTYRDRWIMAEQVGSSGDLAENYEVSGKVLQGGLVSIDTSNSNKVIPSSNNNTNFAGIVATAPAAVMDVRGDFDLNPDTKPVYENERAPIALVGTVPTLITSENGNIKNGDPIGASSLLGFGAKKITRGETVGKAMEEFIPSSAQCTNVSSLDSISWPEDGGRNLEKPCFRLPNGTYVGKIMVYVNPSWHDIETPFLDKAQSPGITDALTLETNGSTRNVISQAHLLPSVNNTYDLGSNNRRWKDLYVQGTINIGTASDSGGIRYDTEAKRLEFTNDGKNWMGLGPPTNTVLLSAQYPGGVIMDEEGDIERSIKMGNTGTESNAMNYYEWNNSDVFASSNEIRVRYQLPSDFRGWGGDGGVIFNYATESGNAEDNKIDFHVYDQNLTAPESSSTGRVSVKPGKWEEMKILGLPFSRCNSPGDVCMFVIKMFSSNDNSVKVGDIKITYERNL
jgi:hypothetical protein